MRCLEQTLLGWQWHCSCPGVFFPKYVKYCCTSPIISALLFHLVLYITYGSLALVSGHQWSNSLIFYLHYPPICSENKVFRSSLCCFSVCLILNCTLLLIFLGSFHSHIKTFTFPVIVFNTYVPSSIGEENILILDYINAKIRIHQHKGNSLFGSWNLNLCTP